MVEDRKYSLESFIGYSKKIRNYYTYKGLVVLFESPRTAAVPDKGILHV